MWQLMRFAGGKLELDSKITKDVEDFTQNEQRFAGLKTKAPARYQLLMEQLKADVAANRKVLEALAAVQ